MKVSYIQPNIYHRAKQDSSAVPTMRESAHGHSKTESKINQIDTTIKRNSDGRASFKGAGATPLLHSVAKFTSDNPLVAEALFAILITCGLRPLTIMATAKSDADKEKCSYQAAKSISSGLVGLGMTAVVGTPIAAATKIANNKGAFNLTPEMKEQSLSVVNRGVEALKGLAVRFKEEGVHSELSDKIGKLTEGGKLNLGVFTRHGRNAQKVFTQEIKEKAPEVAETVKAALSEQKVLNNYAKAGKNVIDKLFQPVFMPLRAMVTIALVPVILGVLGKKKPGKKVEKNINQNPQKMLNIKVFQTENEKTLFGDFAGGMKNEN